MGNGEQYLKCELEALNVWLMSFIVGGFRVYEVK